MLQTELEPRPTKDISLNFVGPFAFTGKTTAVFQLACAAAASIHVWTIRQRRDDTHLIYYVRETTGLGSRHREHLIQTLWP